MYTKEEGMDEYGWDIMDPDGNLICTVVGSEEAVDALLSHLNR